MDSKERQQFNQPVSLSTSHETNRIAYIRNLEQHTPSTEDSALLNMSQKISKYKLAFKNRRLIVDFLSILFGIGSWIGVNSIYVQLPLLVETAPEQWSLPSFLVIMIQLANIGPLLYTFLHKFFPNKLNDSLIIGGILITGSISAIFTSFFHKNTAIIGGENHSVALFVLVFFLALVGCTSSVLFMPYMGRFKVIYLISYLIGEGFSGFIPSIVSLIQGVGGNAECIPKNTTEGLEYERYVPPPRFSTKSFFIIIFSMMVCSTIAFILLDVLRVCKKEYAAVKIGSGNHYEYDESHKNNVEGVTHEPKEKLKIISKSNYRLLLLLMGIVCLFGNGVFPGLQSYSCLPYGNVAYHLTVSLSSIANPVACFLAVFLPHTSIRYILTLVGIAGIFTCYTLSTAVLSPNPPLVGMAAGEALVIVCWTILVGLVSYIKLCITTVMRSQGGKSLVWIGAVTQLGSFFGSIITFVLVNYTNVFISYQPC